MSFSEIPPNFSCSLYNTTKHNKASSLLWVFWVRGKDGVGGTG